MEQDGYDTPRKRPRLVDSDDDHHHKTIPQEPKVTKTNTRRTRPFKPSPQIPTKKNQHLRTRSRSTTAATSTELDDIVPTSSSPNSPLPFLDEHFDYEYADEGDFFGKSNKRGSSPKTATLVPKKAAPSVPPRQKASIPRRRHYDVAPTSPSIAPGI